MARTQKTSGESSTLPTVLIFVLNKKSSPIFRKISDHPVNIINRLEEGNGVPLGGIPILPVSDIISGIYFVSSIVFEINSSNYNFNKGVMVRNRCFEKGK